MEALDSPSILRAPMGGAMLSENRKLVYAGNRHNDIQFRLLPEIHFRPTASGFFLKTFDRLCVFVFVSFFFFFFFFASLHIMKSRKKNKTSIKINLHDLQTGRTSTLLCRSFSDYHVKRAYSLCVIKN